MAPSDEALRPPPVDEVFGVVFIDESSSIGDSVTTPAALAIALPSRPVQAAVSDLIDARLPRVVGMPDADRKVVEHQLARVAPEAQHQPPPSRAPAGGGM